MGQFRNFAGLLSASGNVSPLAYALFIRPPEVHWSVASPVSLFGWDPLLRIHVSGLSSVRGSILAYVLSIYVSKVWRQSFSSITVQSYIVVILSSSFILLLMALLIVRHGYDYIESTLPVFLVSYCMKCVHD